MEETKIRKLAENCIIWLQLRRLLLCNQLKEDHFYIQPAKRGTEMGAF